MKRKFGNRKLVGFRSESATYQLPGATSRENWEMLNQKKLMTGNQLKNNL